MNHEAIDKFKYSSLLAKLENMKCSTHTKVKFPLLIPYIKTSEIVKTIINEMEDELKLIFDIQ